MTLLQGGKFEEAVDSFRQLLTTAGGAPDGLYGLSLAYMGLGKYRDAVRALLRAKSLWPHDAEIGEALTTSYKHIVASEPTNVKLLHDQGSAHYDIRQYAEAIAAWKQGLTVLSDDKVIIHESDVVEARPHVERGKAKESEDSAIALKAYERALDLDPENPLIENHRARMYLALNTPGTAFFIALHAYHLAKDDPRSLHILEKSLEELTQEGRNSLPVRKSQKKTLRVPARWDLSDVELWQARLHNNIAWTYATADDDQTRDPAEALTHAKAEESIRGDDDPLSLHVMAAAHAADKNFSDAVATQQKAISLLCWINSEKGGDFEKASQLYGKKQQKISRINLKTLHNPPIKP